MAECTIEELRATEGCPANTTLKALNWAQLQMLCSINDWLSGVSINECDFDDLLEEGRCSNASVVELEYWQTLKLCELVTGLSGGGGIGGVFPVGTPNYLPKWSASAPHLTPTSLVYDNGTSVSVGGATPLYRLDVQGTANINARTIGINNAPAVYLPDQANFLGSIAVGNGLRLLSHTALEEGYYNASVGYLALVNVTTGRQNNAFGTGALANLTTAFGNIAMGHNAGQGITTGCDNVAIGTNCMIFLTLGWDNAAFGANALKDLTGAQATSSENTALGVDSLYHITTGQRNVAVGCMSGRFLSDNVTNKLSGDESVYIGYRACGSVDGAINEIVIGRLAVGLGSNTVTIGDSAITKTYLQGNVGIGLQTFVEKLEVAGYVLAASGIKLGIAGSGTIINESDVTRAITFEADPGGLGAGSYMRFKVDSTEYMRFEGGLVKLGGTTIAFPALRRTGDDVDFRVADDSGWADINAAFVQGASGFKIGTASSGVILNDSDVSRSVTIGADNGALGAASYLRFNVDGVEAIRILAGGQVSINQAAPNVSAKFQVDSTTQGVLPPRMTKAQRDAIGTPADGLLLYQTDGTAGVKARVGGAWVTLNTTADP